MNKTCNKTFGWLYENTMNRFDILRRNGYKVTFIWENDFRKNINLYDSQIHLPKETYTSH
jgi:hypothetical protein